MCSSDLDTTFRQLAVPRQPVMHGVVTSAAERDPRLPIREILATRPSNDVMKFKPSTLSLCGPVANGTSLVHQHVVVCRQPFVCHLAFEFLKKCLIVIHDFILRPCQARLR